MTGSAVGIELYWLPLGAGGHVVRWNGRTYEALVARREGRRAMDLYHSALRVTVPPRMWVVEMTPAWGGRGDRGVVGEGAVGTRYAACLPLFRYEVRCWPGGTISDVAHAVCSPQRLASDPATCQRLLEILPSVPTPTWGRDELGAGEMWNSNSTISWALTQAGLDPASVRLVPPHV